MRRLTRTGLGAAWEACRAAALGVAGEEGERFAAAARVAGVPNCEVVRSENHVVIGSRSREAAAREFGQAGIVPQPLLGPLAEDAGGGVRDAIGRAIIESIEINHG